jgi:hypothetical protein
MVTLVGSTGDGPAIPEEATNENLRKNRKKARAASRAHRQWELARDRRAEGKLLLEHYRSKGRYLNKGNIEGNPDQPLFTVPPRWSDGRLKWTSNTFANEIVSNTAEYLDKWFPANTTVPSTSPVRLRFYKLNVRPALTPDEDWYYDVTFTAQRSQKSLLPKTGTWWREQVKGKQRHERMVIMFQQLDKLKTREEALAKEISDLGYENLVTGEEPTKTGTPVNYGNKALQYNVGMVNEAYFGSSPGFQELINNIGGGNKPGVVTAAEELWKDSKSNKGMIWLYTDGTEDTLTVQPEKNKPAKGSRKRWAFQFHYNPSTVDMAWGGNPDIDVTMESSGMEKFNLLGGQTMSTISFDLVINRIFDMQYYRDSGLLRNRFSKAKNPYSPREPSDDEQRRIYNFGTMYDVEYLLATILGYKLNTRFRGVTSDIGFLNGRPVDLHLGHRLRYWGYISDVSVSHVMFDERMVPIFSTMRITFNRIPDYPKDKD